MKTDADSPGLAKLLKEKDFTSHAPRERILAAALKLFVEQGYFNTNVPDLSRESKCSVGSIYHNFKNKEEVAASLYQEGICAFRQAMDRSLGDEEDVEKVIKKVVRSFLMFSEVNHQLSKYMWLCRHNEFMSGAIRHPTIIGFDRLGRKITRAIKTGIRSGKLRPLRANIIWAVLFGVPQGYVRDWLDGRNNTPPPSQAADDLAEACWRALT